MHDGMGGMGGMMWGMGIGHLLVVVVVLLAIAALIKYVFSDEPVFPPIGVKRMSVIRLILAVLISVGLILSPLQAATMMQSAPAALTDTAERMAGPPAQQDCACCKLAARCPMAVCAIHCVQFAPSSAAPKRLAMLGHAAFAGLLSPLPEGLGWQPPSPPPRA